MTGIFGMSGSSFMGEYTDYLNEVTLEYKDIAVLTEPTEAPDISVIIPCYNAEKYLDKCLDSLIRQSFKNFEVICIDDGSTDCTSWIINGFSYVDKRFKSIKQDNAGPSKARNEGFKIAQGKYVTFIDADDWVDTNYLEKLYNSAIENNCDIAVSTMVRKRENSQKYRMHFTEEKVYTSLADKIDVCRIPVCCYACGKLYKKEIIENLKFEEGVYFEDVIWTPQALDKSDRLVTVPGTTYWYRVNKNSIVKKVQNNKKQFDSYKAKKFAIEYLTNRGITFSKKCRTFTREIKYFCGIPFCKIKEYENVDTHYLFGLLPIKKTKTNFNILVFNTACLGDVLICNSLVQNIKQQYPFSKVIFVCDKKSYDGVVNQLGVDECIIYDKKGEHKGLLGFIKFLKSFPYRNAYAAFICYRNTRNYFISLLSGARHIIQLKNKYAKNCSLHKSITNLLKDLNGSNVKYLPIKYNLPKEVSADLLDKITNKKIISFCPITSNPKKDIPLDTAISLIKSLNENKDIDVVLTGVGDRCLKYSEELIRNGCRIINCVNKTTVSELAYILNSSEALITADTGTLHLGCAVGVPIVAIWYQENITDYAPDPNIYNSILINKNQTPENIINALKIVMNKQKDIEND